MEAHQDPVLNFGAFSYTPEARAYMQGDNSDEIGLRRCKDYADRMALEYDLMLVREWLPGKVERVLDIGCGLAGIDVFISRNHGVKGLFLLDGDGTGPRAVGYTDECKPWHNAKVAAKFVKYHVPDLFVVPLPPDPNQSIEVDFIISLLSWGHHYPVDVYLKLAQAALQSGSRLILDLREGKGGRETLEKNGFMMLDWAMDSPRKKCRRALFERV